ncbi:MAG TPA: redox-sensing transcriptional repressor Rex [Candidatus Eremiobacteraceae bacterium]|nr:redox-sensing transcriptional repressor Rex [Candidatus Eremiobacteraceae bacterium]
MGERRKTERRPQPKRKRASSVVVISLPRLFLYHRALEDALRAGKQMVTSTELSRRVGRGISSTQVRKDLSHVGKIGRRGQGYDVVVLVRRLASVLGLDRDWRLAIVGFGYLGHALAAYLEYREEKFHIAGIFDNDDAIVGTQWHGVRISHVDDLERVLPVLGCSIGIITVPAPAAQAIADRLVACGVTALLNFAPAALKLPHGVALRAIDLASELSILTSQLG